jgi:hypothetical protein
MGHFVAVLCLGLQSEPRISQVDSLRWLVEDHTVDCQILVIPFEPLMVLSQPAQIGLYDASNLVLLEGLLVEPSFDDFLFESVVILP